MISDSPSVCSFFSEELLWSLSVDSILPEVGGDPTHNHNRVFKFRKHKYGELQGSILRISGWVNWAYSTARLSEKGFT